MPESTPTPAEENLSWLLDVIAGKPRKPPASENASLLEAIKGMQPRPAKRAPSAEQDWQQGSPLPPARFGTHNRP